MRAWRERTSVVVVSGWPGQKLGFGVEAYLVDSFLSHLVTRFRCGHVRANKKVASRLESRLSRH